MPTPRRGSRPASKSSPVRPRDSTSSSHPHHHQTADELALQEAEEILESDDEDPSSPRAVRYAELTRKREHSVEPDSTPGNNGRGSSQASVSNDGSEAESDSEAAGSSSDGSSEASSDSDSDSASDSEDSSATSDSDEDDDDELERHLMAARKAAVAREAKANSKVSTAAAVDDDGELRFEKEVNEA